MSELVRTGIVRSDEANRIGEEDSLDMFESNWFIPLKWSVEVLKGAQKEGLIKTPPGQSFILQKKNYGWLVQCLHRAGHCLSRRAKNVHNCLQNATTRHQKAFKEFLQRFNEITSYIPKAKNVPVSALSVQNIQQKELCKILH